MLKINQDTVDAMIAHALSEAPLEACGYLAEKDGVICKCIVMKNIDASHVHYSMEPAEQFAAMRKCRSEGLTIRAVYHTHPETAAYPSREDIRLAHDPDVSYVIISLAEPNPAINSYIIQKGDVAKEQIEIIGADK